MKRTRRLKVDHGETVAEHKHIAIAIANSNSNSNNDNDNDNVARCKMTADNNTKTFSGVAWPNERHR